MTPTLTEFDPFKVKWQGQAITDIRTRYDFSLGVHEVLLSGSVGSAKSLFIAHMAVTHCLFNKGARCLIGRRSMPDLKDTILQTILEHLEDDNLEEGVDYVHDKTKAKITFSNGSEIISRSWADGKYKKMRSLLLSMAIIEELTENDKNEFYKEIKMRVGRLPHIGENLIISATNPDAPSHWAHKYFVNSNSSLRHVYYSVTTDNPFLPTTYIENLKETLSPKEARRMLYGEWIELAQDVVYYNYATSKNFIDKSYEFNRHYPIDIMFDFNIALNKPMSAAIGQCVNNKFHIAKEYIIHSARTEDILYEMLDDGVFNTSSHFRVFGDATGNHRDTRSKHSDYSIIYNFLSNVANIKYQSLVPRSNPPIRRRHNLVNACCEDANGEVKLYVYSDAKGSDEGLRLTKLKEGANYIEDDSFEYQHVTTAIGYWICGVLLADVKKKTHTQRRF